MANAEISSAKPMARQPAIFLSHGGGPCFWIDFPAPFGPKAFEPLRHYLAGLLASLPQRPRAILIISAHWEAALPTVTAVEHPSMIYDYNGFPDHTYQLHYPAPGAPELAGQVQTLLQQAGIESARDKARGFDHGVFVPMLIVDPKAEIPVVTLSLQEDLNPAEHLAIGAALAPLRDDNVLILGSGNSYHNLREFFDGTEERAAMFDGWLTEAVTQPDSDARRDALVHWAQAPQARACHPREEHLLPLMVIAGAGGTDPATRSFHDVIGGKAISGFTFSAPATFKQRLASRCPGGTAYHSIK